MEAEQRLEKLENVVNAALGRVNTAAFTLVSATIYLIVACLATTHRDLLIGRSFSLPVFDVEVALVPFYFLAPLVLVALHVGALQILAQAVNRLRDLDQHLRDADAERRTAMARLLSASPLVDLFICDDRRLISRVLLLVTVVAPHVLLPVAVLLWMQTATLPMQDAWLTAWMVACLVADVVALWLLFPRLRRGAAVFSLAHPFTAMAAVGSVLLVAAGIGLLLAQQLAMRPWATLDLDGKAIATNEGGSADESKLELLVKALDPDTNAKAAEAFAAIDHAAERTRSIDLSGRSLRRASLFGTKLVYVDLSGADLSGADLRFADLRGASLDGTMLHGASLNEARLEGADLTGADLTGVEARFARLDGAVLHGTRFDDGDLKGAHLRLVRFDDPPPVADEGDIGETGPARENVGLRPPSFRGTNLRGAQIYAMPLDPMEWAKVAAGAWPYQGKPRIDLRGADLQHAVFYAVNLATADFAGAKLSRATILPPAAPGSLSQLPDEIRNADVTSAYDFGPSVAMACTAYDFGDVIYSAANLLTPQTWDHIRIAIRALKALQAECLIELRHAAGLPAPEEDVRNTVADSLCVMKGERPQAAGTSAPMAAGRDWDAAEMGQLTAFFQRLKQQAP